MCIAVPNCITIMVKYELHEENSRRATKYFWSRDKNVNFAGVSACRAILLKPGFHYTANATTTTQKQSDYMVEQSSFTLITLF